MAPEKDKAKVAVRAVKKKSPTPIKKTTPKTAKKARLPVRVVGKKVAVKDRYEEDVLEETAAKDFVTEQSDDKEFFKRSLKKTEKEAEEKKKKEPVKNKAEEIEEVQEQEVVEIKEEDKKISPVKSRSIGLYRKLSLFFVALTFLLLITIFYLYFVSLVVEVSPKKERKTDKVSFLVVNFDKKDSVSSDRDLMDGAVEQIPIKEEGVFNATGAKILGREIMGKVIIHNKKADRQVLIATTRLMSPEGKVYRIRDRVEIDPNGQIEVEIYTDEPSEEMAIGATRFTLPALWAGLQDKVYAESKEAFVYNTKVEKYVQQIDIDKGLQELRASMLDKIARQFGDNYKGFDKVIFELDRNSFEVSIGAKAGDKVDSFNISIASKINIVAFKNIDAELLAENKFISKTASDKKVLGLEKTENEYALASVDFSTGQAVIELSFVGFLSSRKGDALVDREKLIGLNEGQIRGYLSGLDDFSDFNLIFSPSFMKKAPILVDRIKIVVKE